MSAKIRNLSRFIEIHHDKAEIDKLITDIENWCDDATMSLEEDWLQPIIHIDILPPLERISKALKQLLQNEIVEDESTEYVIRNHIIRQGGMIK